MNLNAKSVLTSIVRRQEGQILPWVAFMLISFAGISAFVVDIGRGIIAYHMLQASCDAAAMAGVQLMGSDFTQTSTAIANQATLYSSVAGNKNANSSLLPGAAMVSGYPKVYCSATGTANSIPCVGAVGTANAITVSQKLQLPTIFASIVGIPKLTIGATSSALMAGAAAQKYNIAIVIDTTQSMTSSDPGGCTGSPSKIKCALSGFQTLLSGLTPCSAGSSSSTCTGFDSVAVFTYPEQPANTVTNDTTCPTKTPSVLPYTAPTAITSSSIATSMSTSFTQPTWTSSSATYQLTGTTTSTGGTNGFLSNWSSNNQVIGTNTSNYTSSSGVAAAAGAASGCSGMQAKGGEGTYFAGAIYAAGAALAAQGAAVANSKNALIILSDGDASSSSSQFASSVSLNNSGTNKGNYPSSYDECQQAITAAQNVSNYVPNTTVFTIAYNASNSATSTCSTDSPRISACSTMQQMATATQDAYADTSSSCTGQTVASLPAIFGAIRTKLSNPRLLNPGS